MDMNSHAPRVSQREPRSNQEMGVLGPWLLGTCHTGSTRPDGGNPWGEGGGGRGGATCHERHAPVVCRRRTLRRRSAVRVCRLRAPSTTCHTGSTRPASRAMRRSRILSPKLAPIRPSVRPASSYVFSHSACASSSETCTNLCAAQALEPPQHAIHRPRLAQLCVLRQPPPRRIHPREWVPLRRCMRLS